MTTMRSNDRKTVWVLKSKPGGQEPRVKYICLTKKEAEEALACHENRKDFRAYSITHSIEEWHLEGAWGMEGNCVIKVKP